MKPTNSVYVGGKPLDPADDDGPDEPMVCPICHGRRYVWFEKIDFKTLRTIRGSYDCPECCKDL